MRKRKPKGYWTKERCWKEALKYNTRNEFKRGCESAYTSARINGWLDEICSHMINKYGIIWVYDECLKEALKYNTRSEFQKGSSSAYGSAHRNGWLDEICSHMVCGRVIWTYDKCKEKALKCSHRGEFQKKYFVAYSKARKNGWLDEICSHMKPKGSLKNRFIYSYEFKKTNSVYVGLTYDMDKRNIGHLYNGKNKSAVYKHIKKYNLSSNDYELVIHGEYEMAEAGEQEGIKLKEYINDGWNILNRTKTGNLGGSNYSNITYQECVECALKCESRTEFLEKYRRHYSLSSKMGWLNEICSHMELKRKPPGYWNDKERCHKEALNYNSRSKFQKECSSVYISAHRNGWLDEICSHMSETIKPSGYWNYKERCHKEAFKYESRTEFHKGSGSAYESARINGWLDEICSHMKSIRKPSGYWDYKQNCKKEALKHNSRSEFQKGCNIAYKAALKNRWLDEFFPK